MAIGQPRQEQQLAVRVRVTPKESIIHEGGNNLYNQLCRQATRTAGFTCFLMQASGPRIGPQETSGVLVKPSWALPWKPHVVLEIRSHRVPRTLTMKVARGPRGLPQARPEAHGKWNWRWETFYCTGSERPASKASPHEDEGLAEAGEHVGLCTNVGQLQPSTTPRRRKRHFARDKKSADTPSRGRRRWPGCGQEFRELNSGG